MRNRAFVALGLALACTEFPSDPQRTITIRPTTGWTRQWFVRDSDTLTIQVTLPDSTRIDGLNVEWQSDDPGVLEVIESAPTGTSKEDSLSAQLRAKAVAHARGTAHVRVLVSTGGAFEATQFVDSIVVSEKWILVSAGYQHTCALAVTNQAYCWGTGFLGNGSAAGSLRPVHINGGLRVTSLTTGDRQSCATVVDGTAYCWGENDFGAIGNGSALDQLAPTPIALGNTFRALTAGEQGFVCGVTPEQLGFCWGLDDTGQLGDGGYDGTLGPIPPFDNCGTFTPIRCSLAPRPVQDTGFVRLRLLAIGPGHHHACGILLGGTTVCWGSGSVEIGSATQIQTDTAVALPGTVQFRSVSAGLFHNCGIAVPVAQVYCWGANSHGQLGRSAPNSSRSPLLIADTRLFLELSTRERSTCGIAAADSTVYCWGSNEYWQLGRSGSCDPGTPPRCSTPVKVDLTVGAKVVSISVGQRHACAVTLLGSAFCWGQTVGGKLGNPSAVGPLSLPVRVSEP